MLFYPTFFETSQLLFLYVLVYNFTLFLLLWNLSQFSLLSTKTFHSFSDIKMYPYVIFSLNIIFFSMAGVPPFLGFFTKILILFLLINSAFFLFYFMFLILLLIGLYFYMQNIRFINSLKPSKKKTPYNFFFFRSVFFYINFIFLFFIITGFIYIDDIILILTWFLV